MANKNLFQSTRGALLPVADTKNAAGGIAYAHSPEHALAQYAVTGCLNSTYYTSAEDQLAAVLDLGNKVDPEYLAKVAVYARENGFMKDLPALLTAMVSVRAPDLLAPVFKRTIDNGKMLRNFVQIMRSGVVGRKSLGSSPKRLVTNWILNANEWALMRAAVGNTPSLADVVKMVHPKPREDWQEAWFAWLIGKEYNAEMLPALTAAFEIWKRDRTQPMPDIDFRFLDSVQLTTAEWDMIARNAGWQMTRMNIQTFKRKGVLANAETVKVIADRLRDASAIHKAKVFPYQLFMAYMMTGSDNDVPFDIREALQDAMEVAIDNVPTIAGQVVVCPDVSGSMSSAVTGNRGSATSKMRCIDVAALVAASFLRKNPTTRVLPFDTSVHPTSLNPRDSVMTNAKILSGYGGGGTTCHLAIDALIQTRVKADLVVMVSDYESWCNQNSRGNTSLMQSWERYKQSNPKAKMVLIDINPYGTTQAKERSDILNIGGFSDQVFSLIAAFSRGELTAGHWTGIINDVQLVEG